MSKKISEQVFDSVQITHFINPHMFWFRRENSYIGNYKFFQFEENLQNFYRSQKNFSLELSYKPTIGEFVAVYMPNWSKWIRGVVETIISLLQDENNKYLIWAHDLGFPLQSEEKFIRKLPKEFAEEKLQICYFAGISNIIPCEKHYNFEKMETEMLKMEKWSPLALKEFENINLRSSKITFISELEYKNQLFGRLEMTTHEGKVHDLSDILIKLDIGVRSFVNFVSDLEKCSTTKLERYMTNDGIISIQNLNYNKQNPHQYEVSVQHKSSNSLPSREVAKKVLDWTTQNEKLFRENEIDEELINEIDNMESVSCIQENINHVDSFSKKEKHNKKLIEKDDEEICVMKTCGSNRKLLKEKYLTKNIRQPAISFDINGSSSTTNEDQGNSSIYVSEHFKSQKKLFQKFKEKKKKQEKEDMSNCNKSVNLDSSTNDSIITTTTGSEENNSISITIPQESIDTTNKHNLSEIGSIAGYSDIRQKYLKQKHKLKAKEETKVQQTSMEKPIDDKFVDEELIKKVQEEKRKIFLKNSKKKPVISMIPAGFDLSRLSDLNISNEN